MSLWCWIAVVASPVAAIAAGQFIKHELDSIDAIRAMRRELVRPHLLRRNNERLTSR